MQLKDFYYQLLPEQIAQTPIYPRDHSRLLCMNRQTGKLQHGHFYDFPSWVEAGDTLVFNDTRVIPARLFGIKVDTGAKIEVFLLRRLNNAEWEVLVKPGKKAKIGTVLQFGELLSGVIEKTTDFGGRIIRFSFTGLFENLLDELGETPLPPYIHSQLEDKARYQTVYAKEDGSSAAPTAGLHFTDEMLNFLRNQGVNLAFVTLHIGLGTFRPVQEQIIEQHHMHKEFYSLTPETVALLQRTKELGKRVIAVGTTSVRTLETAAKDGRLQPGSGWTDIFIYPGYTFQVVDALVTNFHLPESTLLMLVSAFSSRENVLQAYQEAIKQNYRFFSFGDAMFLY